MERLTVIGCGTMGPSIALTAACAGLSVNLYGINSADIRQEINDIHSKLKNLENMGFNLFQEKEIMCRITTTSSLWEAIEGSTFVVEAILEEMQLKKKLFVQLSDICGKGVIIASNTSGLSPSFLSSSVTNPDRFIVTHFWNPAHLIPIVEVVPAKQTSKKTLQHTVSLLKVMNKKAVVLKKEIPEFIANRLQFALFREALYLLEKGIASKEDIDAAVVYSFGRRLCVTGPLASVDMGGLDIYDQHFGSKTGTGFYKWSRSFNHKMNTKRENELIRFLKEEL